MFDTSFYYWCTIDIFTLQLGFWSTNRFRTLCHPGTFGAERTHCLLSLFHYWLLSRSSIAGWSLRVGTSILSRRPSPSDKACDPSASSSSQPTFYFWYWMSRGDISVGGWKGHLSSFVLRKDVWAYLPLEWAFLRNSSPEGLRQASFNCLHHYWESQWTCLSSPLRFQTSYFSITPVGGTVRATTVLTWHLWPHHHERCLASLRTDLKAWSLALKTNSSDCSSFLWEHRSLSS